MEWVTAIAIRTLIMEVDILVRDMDIKIRRRIVVVDVVVMEIAANMA
jgi:hypothetical protein